ncbi:unnamed protein product [Phyllotreta striolata]|uniref:Uncharacterized protein n=1 Tax=Phyllotreta striolata TaxID=444603 RepID=A0A9N9XIX0_PHYSR|nr:unnamed protein product [Phyllotreta striolata]
MLTNFRKMKYFGVLLCFTIVWSYKLPGAIKTCHRSQPDFAECVAKGMRVGLEAFASGNKEMGVPPLDPYFVEKLDIKTASSSGNSVSLHLIFSNLLVHGMTNSDAVHMELDVDKGCSWIMDVDTALIKLEGDYEVEGKVLVFPLNARGKAVVSQVMLHNRHSMWCEKYKKNGKTYIRFTNYTMDMHPEKMIYNFSDVFPSNKQIENEISKTLNENSIEIFNEMRSSFEQIFSTIHITVANQILSKIPFDEVFLP